ncbi:MAG: hypothetical protein WDW36_010358 [Sanguina aurantia]
MWTSTSLLERISDTSIPFSRHQTRTGSKGSPSRYSTSTIDEGTTQHSSEDGGSDEQDGQGVHPRGEDRGRCEGRHVRAGFTG